MKNFKDQEVQEIRKRWISLRMHQRMDILREYILAQKSFVTDLCCDEKREYENLVLKNLKTRGIFFWDNIIDIGGPESEYVKKSIVGRRNELEIKGFLGMLSSNEKDELLELIKSEEFEGIP